MLKTKLITDGIWATLSREAKKKTPAEVAVAYFAQGAARLLPLSKGSRLVVDASEQIVKQGQTHPKDLETMRRRGVAVYSYPRLHAKIFVFGNVAYIGSTNVSSSSAASLQEAVLRTKDTPVVSAARTFIQGLCNIALGPAELRRLQKKYRSPRGGNVPKANRRHFPDLIRLAQTQYINEPESLTTAREKGHEAAAKRRTHGRGWTVTEFSLPGPSLWRRGDRIVMVHEESAGRRVVSPPGHVIHLQGWRSGHRRKTIVYFEHRDRWAPFSEVARTLDSRDRKRLMGRGIVRSPRLAKRLDQFWR